MNVTTKYTSTTSGAGRILARSGDTRKTVPYDHALSPDQNHGLAVAALVEVMDSKDNGSRALHVVKAIGEGSAKHETPESGVHKFQF